MMGKRECLISNWKIFYPNLQEVQKYKLGHPRTFHYLNQSNCYELDGVDDSKEYIETKRAMDIVGITFDEQVNYGCWLK